MGQILAIGIVTECLTSKKELQKYNITIDELIEEMKIKQHFEPSIYDFSETEEYYFFKLRPDIIESQLHLFLEKFYPLVYLGRDSDYKETIETLKKTAPREWLKLSDEKSFEAFQVDKYGEPSYLYFDKPFQPCAKIYYTSIMLSQEGKISMESYGRQFNFFKYCIQETFSEYSIAKAVRTYISG